MKKYLFIFSLLAVMLTSMTSAFAASEDVTIMDEGYDLKSIKTMAIATPYYTPSLLTQERRAKLKEAAQDEIITPDMITQAAIDVAKQDKIPIDLLSDADVNEAILSDTGIDVSSLSKAEAKKVYKAQIKNYADAYVVFTITNDSHVVMFADIYDAKTNRYVYSYRIIGGKTQDDNMKNYNMFMHKFFRTLDIEMQKK